MKRVMERLGRLPNSETGERGEERPLRTLIRTYIHIGRHTTHREAYPGRHTREAYPGGIPTKVYQGGIYREIYLRVYIEGYTPGWVYLRMYIG